MVDRVLGVLETFEHSAWARRGLLVFSVLLIGLFLATWIFFVGRYGVDVLRWDQWDTPGYQIAQFLSDDLSFSDLLSQHNEARKLFPNLISLSLVAWSGVFDTSNELYIGLSLTAVLIALVGYGAWRSLQRADLAALIAAGFTALIFSSHTLQFHMLSVTFERLIPELCLLLFLVAFSHSVGWATLILAAACAFVAQFSYPGGAALWGTVLLYLAFTGRLEQRRRLLFLGFIVVAAVASSAFYFKGYLHPSYHSDPIAILASSVVEMARFLCAFIGNAITFNGSKATLFGAVVLVAFAGLALLVLKRERKVSCRDAQLFWIVVASYSISQAILSMIGRLPMGFRNALRPDYVTHPIYIIVAVLVLAIMYSKGWVRRILVVSVMAACPILFGELISPATLDALQREQDQFAESKSCFILFNLHENGGCLTPLYPDRPDRFDLFARAEPFLRYRILEEFRVGEPIVGAVDAVAISEDEVQARGWVAWQGQTVDALLGSVGDLSRQSVVGLAPIDRTSANVVRDNPPSVQKRILWTYRQPLSEPVSDICSLRFFGFDSGSGILQPIAFSRTSGCGS
jgi:hypothetical protein